MNDASVPYSFGAAASLGWETFRRQWVWLLIACLLFSAITSLIVSPFWAAGVLGAVLGKKFQGGAGPAVGVGLGAVLCCGIGVIALVSAPLQAGLHYAAVAAVRGKMEITDLFLGFKRFGAVLGTALLGGLISLGVTVVCLIPALAGAALTVGMHEWWPAVLGLILSLPFVIAEAVLLSVFIAIPCVLVVDPQVRARGGLPALSLAWELGRRISPSYFALIFCYGLLAAACSVVTCGLGAILFGSPLLLAVQGSAYHLITAPMIARGPDPRRHA